MEGGRGSDRLVGGREESRIIAISVQLTLKLGLNLGNQEHEFISQKPYKND